MDTKLQLTESYLMTFDMDDTGDALLTVVAKLGKKMDYVGIFRGEDAINLYEKLTNNLIHERGLKNDK